MECLRSLIFCNKEFREGGAKSVIFVDGPGFVTIGNVQKLLGHSPHFSAVCTLRKLSRMILSARFVDQLRRKSTGAVICDVVQLTAVSLPETFQATTIAFSVSSLLGELLSRRFRLPPQAGFQRSDPVEFLADDVSKLIGERVRGCSRVCEQGRPTKRLLEGRYVDVLYLLK